MYMLQRGVRRSTLFTPDRKALYLASNLRPSFQPCHRWRCHVAAPPSSPIADSTTQPAHHSPDNADNEEQTTITTTIGTQGSTTLVEEQEQEVPIPSTIPDTTTPSPPPPPPQSQPQKRPPAPALPDSLISLSLGLISLAASFFSQSWLLTLAGTSLIASGVYSIHHKKATGRTFRGAVRWFAGSTFLIAYECIVMTMLTPVSVIPKLIITATAAACVAFSYTRAVKLMFIGGGGGGGRRRRRRYEEDEEEEMGGVQGTSVAGDSIYGTTSNGAMSSTNSNSSNTYGVVSNSDGTTTSSSTAAFNSMQGDSQTSISLDHDIESYSSSDYDEDFSFDELPNRSRRKKNKGTTNKNDPLTRSIDQVNEAMGGIIREEIFTTNPWAFINTLVLLTGAVIYDNGVWTAWDVTFGDSPEWSSLTAVVVGLLIVASVRIFKIPVVSKIPWQEEE